MKKQYSKIVFYKKKTVNHTPPVFDVSCTTFLSVQHNILFDKNVKTLWWMKIHMVDSKI